MNKLSNSFRFALLGLLTVAFALSARSQLTFSTLAGYPGGDSADGFQGNARFASPLGVATDGAGNIYVADSANHTIRKVSAGGVVTTLAGLPGISGSADGTNSTARFNQPGGVAVDTNGNVYVADTGNHTIRQVTPAGVVTTWAGQAGVSGSIDQIGTNALFNFPRGVAVSSAGYLYVADYGNHTIRKITPGRSVLTFAGASGNPGSNDAGGTSARFNQPQGVAVDAADYVYVADTANGTIRRISPSATVTTLAGFAGVSGSNDGAGTNAQFYQPEAVAVDASGNLYVADFFNNTIRLVTQGGVVTTLAGLSGSLGSADGTNSLALFWGPEGVAVNSAGQLYVADTGNNTIRKIIINGPDAVVTTIAGSASIGTADATGNNARFFWPGGMAMAGASAVYIADTENSTIRRLTAAGLAGTVAGSPGSSGSADGSTNTARFWGPQGVAVDRGGNLYVADSANSTIRKVAIDGTVTTMAGAAGSTGTLDGTNSGALFYNPQAVCVDLAGNVYVADTWNHTIRKVTAAGVVSTIAGSPGNYGNADGTNGLARFNWPSGIALDAGGNLYVSDYFNHTVRKMTPAGTNWVVSTVAGLPGVWGSADGTNNAARFYRPQGIAVDSTGNLYVVDSGNETTRKLVLSGTNWVVSTVGGLAGVSGSTNGLGSGARFRSPAGIAISSGGTVFVADSGNNTIRLSALLTNNAPAIINQPLSQTINPSNNVAFSVNANGGTPLSYQWRFNTTNIAGMTGSSYTLTNAQLADAGNYSVLVTNASGSVLSADAALIVNIPAFILVQPQPQFAAIGQGATFSVSAGGTAPLTYQWRFLGSNIPGATASAFTLATVQVPNGGAYSVVVTNIAGTAVSSDAVLTVIPLTVQGDNSFGQGTPSLKATNSIAIAAGAWHSLALLVDGHITAWGNNFNGQCNVPEALTDALAIAAGGYHSLAIRANGTVAAWGANDYGQTNLPAGLTNVLAIASGTWHSLALHSDGTVVTWGDNTHSQGNPPPDLAGVVAIAAGGNHSLALKADGTVVAWGDNTAHGGGYGGQSIVPPGVTNVIRIAAGDYHSLAVFADGTVAAWGDNGQGQCDVPEGLNNVVAIAGGGSHTLALKSDGSVVTWGSDSAGQCDLPGGLSDAVGISGGEAHSLILVQSTLPNPRLLNPTRPAGGFSVLVQTLNRKNYALDYNNSVGTTNWTAISTNSGNGALELLSDPAASVPQRFYRMRQW